MSKLDYLRLAHRKAIELIDEFEVAKLFDECDVSIDQVEKKVNTSTRNYFVVFNKDGKEAGIQGSLDHCKKICERKNLKYLIRQTK